MNNLEEEIAIILMLYENPIPVGMDTSKGSIELDQTQTIKHLKKYVEDAIEREFRI